ncbi:MAG: hypothetical protein LBL76_10020 [Treponema sp.]|nr:hypothetical protein [Treponema sp.]
MNNNNNHSPNLLANIMLVRGMGIWDISAVLSITHVLTTLKSAQYLMKSRFSHYDCLEIDEFWTYVGNKKNNIRLIYAYHRESGKPMAYGWIITIRFWSLADGAL